jgi:hypothetical protein
MDARVKPGHDADRVGAAALTPLPPPAMQRGMIVLRWRVGVRQRIERVLRDAVEIDAAAHSRQRLASRRLLFLAWRVGFRVAIIDPDGNSIVDVLVVFEKYRIAPGLIRDAAFQTKDPVARFGQDRRTDGRYFRGARKFGRRKYGRDGCRNNGIARRTRVRGRERRRRSASGQG